MGNTKEAIELARKLGVLNLPNSSPAQVSPLLPPHLRMPLTPTRANCQTAGKAINFLYRTRELETDETVSLQSNYRMEPNQHHGKLT